MEEKTRLRKYAKGEEARNAILHARFNAVILRGDSAAQWNKKEPAPTMKRSAPCPARVH